MDFLLEKIPILQIILQWLRIWLNNTKLGIQTQMILKYSLHSRNLLKSITYPKFFFPPLCSSQCAPSKNNNKKTWFKMFELHLDKIQLIIRIISFPFSLPHCVLLWNCHHCLQKCACIIFVLTKTSLTSSEYTHLCPNGLKSNSLTKGYKS